MINKKVKYTYKGANQDITKSKHSNEYYFEAQHIDLLATSDQSTGSVTNEKGNDIVISIPNILISNVNNTIVYLGNRLNYTNGNEIDKQIVDGILPTISSTQKIINITNTRTGIVVFTTDDNGMDCIWTAENVIEDNYDLKLLYVRNLNFSTNNPIQAIFNYENDSIQKVYWVDGKEQIRFINLKHDSIEGNQPLIDVPSSSINFVGTVNFSQPIVTNVISGGNHTSGMIQYAYNLYRLNSSQTKVSPLSELISLDKGLNNGGGDVNEIVGETPIVEINNIDSSYTNIKVYAIKYTSFNTIPSISLIEERELTKDSITIYDDGSIIESLSLEEFLFLGSDPISPQHIHSKDNRLFPVNIKTKSFVLPKDLDTRAYSFPINSTSTNILDNIGPNQTTQSVSNTYQVINNHDSVNSNYNVNRYQYNSSILGGEGKFIKFEIVQKNLSNPENFKLFKDEELYRIGVEFYNSLGQISEPKWISDYKMPIGNLQSNYNTLKVELKNEFYTWLDNQDLDIVGYRIIRAERNSADKTILTQGVVTPMIFQVLGEEAKNNDQFISSIIREDYQDRQLKFPSYLTREFEKVPNDQGTGRSDNNGVLQQTKHLHWLNNNDGNNNEGGEIFVSTRANIVSQTFMHTKLMQMYSPEILLQNNINFSSGLKVSVKGLTKSTENGVYAESRVTTTKLPVHSGKTLGGINPWFINENLYLQNNEFKRTFNVNASDRGVINNIYGFIGPSGVDDTMDFKQYYRQYNTFIPNTNNLSYNIYGAPEVSERGNESKLYNNDGRYRYSNSLQPFISDGNGGVFHLPINSINSHNIDCLTFMLGVKDDDTRNRKGLEDIYVESSISDPSGMLMIEIKKDDIFLYNGNLYGGNSYEDKRRSDYIKIGEYKNITTNSVQIDNPGDTFVQSFKFLRIGKTDTEVYDTSQTQISEIVEYTTETTVDLKNRNDLSIGQWDSRFQPRYDEYTKYNTVYSQQSNLVKNTDVDFTFNEIKNFDTRIQSTKLKIPNETIDSWTDILVNETMDLDGKFGPINNIIEYKDNLYTFQDEAIAALSINPRVQISGSDGIAVELGKGNILDDYNYLTTRSGSINKWGIISSKKGIYYYDALNKGIGRIPDAATILLSDIKGMHTHFNTNYNYNLIKEDNPILETGVVFGYDNYNNDIYFTFHQGELSFTRRYNELRDEFVDLKSYKPTIYSYKGEKMFLVNPNGKDIYEQKIGEYNKYFNEYVPSYIILQLNPESDIDTVFNNIQYNSELYLNNVDQPDKTLTHIQAYNEYQDSGRIPLIVGRDSNLRRKFREWKANIPRSNRNRIRNPWIFLKLELDNVSNYKLILHDIIVNYSI